MWIKGALVLHAIKRLRKMINGEFGCVSGYKIVHLLTIIDHMEKFSYGCVQKRPRGFTLIELMVTLAVAAVLATLAAPSIRDFIVRSNLTNLSNEFTGSVLRARNEAVNRNTCVTMCMSSSAGGASPACTAAGADWQVGWIAFLNPSCDSGINSPSDSINIILARQTVGDDYNFQAQGSRKKMMFNSRGSPGLGAADQFNIIYSAVNNPLTEKYGINICMDGLGRTRTLPSDKNCSQYK